MASIDMAAARSIWIVIVGRKARKFWGDWLCENWQGLHPLGKSMMLERRGRRCNMWAAQGSSCRL